MCSAKVKAGREVVAANNDHHKTEQVVPGFGHGRESFYSELTRSTFSPDRRFCEPMKSELVQIVKRTQSTHVLNCFTAQGNFDAIRSFFTLKGNINRVRTVVEVL